jgi:hypothetical protein
MALQAALIPSRIVDYFPNNTPNARAVQRLHSRRRTVVVPAPPAPIGLPMVDGRATISASGELGKHLSRRPHLVRVKCSAETLPGWTSPLRRCGTLLNVMLALGAS